MKNKARIAVYTILVLSTIAFLSFLFLSNSLVLLQPKGTIASQQKNLLVFATVLSMVVIIPVFIMTFVIAYKYREGNKKSTYSPELDSNKLAETVWWGIPIAIILLLSVITWKTTHSLDPFKPLASDKPALKIQVVSMQWKWLFIYPEQGLATVNYVQIPEDTPINFEITSDAPMNSFWIPQLGGQIYAMSGMATQLNLMADEPGEYIGSSANISGEGFADMRFRANALTRADFDNWVTQTKSSENTLTDDAYNELANPNKSDEKSYALSEHHLFNNIINKYMYHTASTPIHSHDDSHESSTMHGGEH